MMKFVAALVVLSFVCVSAAPSHFRAFQEYQNKHNKQYASIEEFTERFSAFKQSVARIERKNQQHGTPVFGLNKFSDMTPEEFKSKYLGFKPRADRPKPHEATVEVADSAAPSSFDWRTKGAVSDVKDQEQCGSCWAFSTTEEIESMWFLAGNKLPTLAPQQIVNCDKTDGGCNGGDTVTAYAYVQKAGGMEPESDFPYTGTDGRCKFNSGDVVAKIKGFTYATPPCNDTCDKQDENTLAANLASKGPVSICVYAESWQDYTSGVLKDNCPHDYSSLDHCVQLVGYNKASSDGTPYWIIRNSWNTDWGLEGYIQVEMGKNLCGVADEATFATI